MQVERRPSRPILSTLDKDFAQGESVDQRHGEEDDPAVSPELVGRQECWAGQARSPLRLAPEPSELFRVAPALGHEQLQGHHLDGWFKLDGLPDLPLAASPQRLDEVVAAHPQVSAVEAVPQARPALVIPPTSRFRDTEWLVSRAVVARRETCLCADPDTVVGRGSRVATWPLQEDAPSLRCVHDEPNRSRHRLNVSPDGIVTPRASPRGKATTQSSGEGRVNGFSNSMLQPPGLGHSVASSIANSISLGLQLPRIWRDNVSRIAFARSLVAREESRSKASLYRVCFTRFVDRVEARLGQPSSWTWIICLA